MEDAVSTLTNILSSSWLIANTDGKLPQFSPIYNVPGRIDVGQSDYVLGYSVSHEEKPAGLGYGEVDYTDVVSIDIRTAGINASAPKNRQHLLNMRDEVRRIIYANKLGIGNPITYKQPSVTRIVDLSDRSIGLWRMTLDIKLWKVFEDITGSTV